MTKQEIIFKTVTATESFINKIEEKGDDDILIKSFYFNIFLKDLIEINESLILMQQEEVITKL
jgi:hypothetical protein